MICCDFDYKKESIKDILQKLEKKKDGNRKKNNANFINQDELSTLKKEIKDKTRPLIQKRIEIHWNEKVSQTESFINDNEIYEDSDRCEKLVEEFKPLLPPFIELIIKLKAINENSENYLTTLRNILNFLDYKEKNRLIMVYKGIEGKIKIFGHVFIETNKSKIEIYVNQRKSGPIYEIESQDKFIIIILVEKNIGIIANMSHLFHDCTELIWLNGNNWNTSNITEMSSMFENCCSIKDLSDINKWNTNKVERIENMFKNCSMLGNLDLSNWNTENLKNMKGLFYGCITINQIKGLEKWNVKNVWDISELFKECSSLSYLDNISEWKTLNIKNMAEVFSKCTSLETLPDISKWNTSQVVNMYGLFNECKVLKALPDIYKWDTSNVTNMSFLFNECVKLKNGNIQRLSEWRTPNVNNMRKLFYGCKSLESLPDLSNWNLNKDVKIDNMFDELNYEKIENIPILENGKFHY